MNAILEQVVRSPRFPIWVEELNETLRRERVARERFRASLDEDVRAEFINGEVVEQMSSRKLHMLVLRNIHVLLDAYVRVRRLGTVLQEQALTEFTRNDYVPDICYWPVDQAAAFASDATIFPVPMFVCEVLSPSTEARDRGVKFEDYAAHGVREYWIVDPDNRVIEQYAEREGRYELVGKHTEGTLRSLVIEGFEMPVQAAFDDAANLAAMRAILAP